MEYLNNEKIAEFYNACSDMENAKLILADVKIGRIVKAIMSSSELIAAIGETLVNFNFDSEFAKAQVRNEMSSLYFKLPEDNSKMIALVFNILSQCDAHQLDLHDLIREFFTNENGNMSYGFSNFVQSVIFPFRDAVCEMVGCSVSKRENQQQEQQECNCCDCENECYECDGDILNNFFSDITTILAQIKESVDADFKVKNDKKDEINITIDALMRTIEICDFKIMNALFISLNYLLQPIKSVRFYNSELQERLMQFYDELEA